MKNDHLTAVVSHLFEERYPQAEVIFLAGSVIRNESTSTSDLDLVVIFEKVKNAWRDSFVFENWPIEVFGHDVSTLNYFFQEVDGPAGIPSLAQMIVEGIALPQKTEIEQKIRDKAQNFIDRGPARWDQVALDRSRYLISDIVDDLRDPRSKAEALASGSVLYEKLANFYFRAQGKWSASGKMIPRKLQAQNPKFSEQFTSVFERFFASGDSSELIQLAEKVLEPYGGFLFEGHKLDAPADWRKE